jgi:hypothetical protein
MYWVFEQGQLERALQAYTERRTQEGVSQANADAYQVREFLKSPEAAKLTAQSTPNG